LERNPEEPLQLVSVARISPEKNNRFILQLLKEFPHPVNMVFYGAAGNDEAYVSAFRRDLEQLPPHIAVQWHGFLDPEKLQPELRKSHWFIMPTLGENFGHAIFEALAAGLPVMIGDNTPWKNLQEQNAGWDLSPKNPEPWLRMLETAYRMERERYQTMSADAMKLARAQAASDTAFGQYEQLFKS
jgi:glycosyltransferase involved in cell wall biosynthesis